MKKKRFYSNGKLLLTGEYAVLDGALSLALPTQYGQSLAVEQIDGHQLLWQSFDHQKQVWFEHQFEMRSLFYEDSGTQTDHPVTRTLSLLLREAKNLNPEFLTNGSGYHVTTYLDFPRNWGLGSSSTLINNIAQWAKIDAYSLLWNAFSGSGYDIACAQNDRAILYQLNSGRPKVDTVNFDPPFKEAIYFVHLGKKQNSRDGIAQYREANFDQQNFVEQISRITTKILACRSLASFETLLSEHEELISQTLELPTVKQSLFPDYYGEIKSLGAWGGDFVLATGDHTTPAYFKQKKYTTVLPYSKMII